MIYKPMRPRHIRNDDSFDLKIHKSFVYTQILVNKELQIISRVSQ